MRYSYTVSRASGGVGVLAVHPQGSLDNLAADTFDSDEELDEFLAFAYAERRRDVA